MVKAMGDCLPVINRDWLAPLQNSIVILVGLGMLVACGSTGQMQVFQYSGTEQNIDQVGFREPSGITYHAERGTLFVAGDEGDLMEIAPDGMILQQRALDFDDFEGITADPQSGLLYVIVETPARIIEVEPDGLVAVREFDIDPLFDGQRVIPFGDQGIEGVAFVPDPRRPSGGVLYVAVRVDWDGEAPDPQSPLLVIDLPLEASATDQTTLPIADVIYAPLAGISDLAYDSDRQKLLAVIEADELLVEVSTAGRVTGTYTGLVGHNQEGIALDEAGYLYVALDSGGILKVEWLR